MKHKLYRVSYLSCLHHKLLWFIFHFKKLMHKTFNI